MRSRGTGTNGRRRARDEIRSLLQEKEALEEISHEKICEVEERGRGRWKEP